ncbi:ABC transporter permease [Micromonospora sp. LOL_021]|uniref:ABC transporter permease n=1 Tax=Micromonospora sp. LOL_021 TaxID=3345417 RepID=UPI003A84DB79
MVTLVLRRLLSAIPLLLIVSLGAFSLVALLPGDQAMAIAGEHATPEQLAALRQQLRLDDPFLVRYAHWLGGILQGDLGDSLVTGRAISDEILRRAPLTASIALGTLVVVLLIGVPTGILQGVYAGRAVDRIGLLGSAAGLAVPNFWLATMLITIFAVQLRWLPATGYTPLSEGVLPWMQHLIMPSITLGVFTAAEMARQLRTGFLHAYSQPYVRTAWSKGLPARTVIGKHALKNAAAPAITVLGIRLGHLLSGAVIVESIFGMPGLGKFAIDAILNRDFTVVQAVVLVSAVVVLTANLLVDIAYGLLNPKVRIS